MYYKVTKNDRIIDVLDGLFYLRWDIDRCCVVTAVRSNAQAILSSDGSTFWHAIGLHELPIDGHDSVEVIPIDEYEYKQLRALSLRTPEEIIDNFVLSLVEDGVI